MTSAPRRRAAAPWLLRLVAVGTCAVVVQAPAVPAQAEDAAAARAQAHAAAQHVAEVRAQLATAQAGYAQAMSHVGQQVSDFIVADTARADAQRAADDAADRSTASARALYLSGGQAGLLNTVLSSGDLGELAARLSGVDHVLAAASATADDAAEQARRVQDVADGRSADADASVVTAARLTAQADRVATLLADAQQTLDGLSARARQLTEAEAAARALARARAAAALAQQRALGQVHAEVPPEEYFRLYRAAAKTCPGMDWTLLAAVGQVESGHGRDVGPSSAGAIGPMQFMPGTFASYAVDGDHDGRLDAFSPADAIFTAARYLCSGGAGSSSGVQAALFRYNRAQWYVDLVLSVQAQLQAQQG
ncbi:hypothetical protein GCM10027446_30780 [Angustibacter peucedani]